MSGKKRAQKKGKRLSDSLNDYQIENRNTDYLEDWHIWPLLVAIILGGQFLLSLFMTSDLAWIVVLFLHNIISFVLLHWIKGVPFGDIHNAQGKFDKLTLWEQIDDGVQYSNTRKFFTVELIILYLYVLHITVEHGYGLAVFVLNTATFIPCIIGKMPGMYKVRIFGINKD
mmetsp:Transcript_32392/g.44493  ORF Transcript_32392/g.44493 Transcript_32392/m.44493 type:complete len:171 (+) Transcript_32392:102-614(+)